MPDRIQDTCRDRKCDDIVHQCPQLKPQKLGIPAVHLSVGWTRTKLSFTRRNTVEDRSTSVRMPLRSDETRTNEALESATSLPDPIAIATSAAARAYKTFDTPCKEDPTSVLTGPSLMPSPTMATTQRLFNLLCDNHPSFDRCFFGAFSWSQRTLSA